MGDLKIVVAGCVASQEGQALLRRVPELDLVMGPHHANRCFLNPKLNVYRPLTNKLNIMKYFKYHNMYIM